MGSNSNTTINIQWYVNAPLRMEGTTVAENREYPCVREVKLHKIGPVASIYTAPNTQISGAVYIKGGSKSNTFEYTTAIYTTLFSLAITLYQQPAFHFFPTLLLFLSYSVSYLSNPRSTHLYSDPYSIPG